MTVGLEGMFTESTINLIWMRIWTLRPEVQRWILPLLGETHPQITCPECLTDYHAPISL